MNHTVGRSGIFVKRDPGSSPLSYKITGYVNIVWARVSLHFSSCKRLLEHANRYRGFVFESWIRQKSIKIQRLFKDELKV